MVFMRHCTCGFKECLFWTSEFYYSGYFIELWNLIWKIYYDFYAIIHPKLEKFIIKIEFFYLVMPYM